MRQTLAAIALIASVTAAAAQAANPIGAGQNGGAPTSAPAAGEVAKPPQAVNAPGEGPAGSKEGRAAVVPEAKSEGTMQGTK